MDLGGEAAACETCGELCDLRSSLLPRIDDIDIPPPGRLDEKDARSRAPANGEAVGGPRGAEPGSDEALEGICGGDGGGIWRDWKGGACNGGSGGPAMPIRPCFSPLDQACAPWPFGGGLPGPPKERRREGS